MNLPSREQFADLLKTHRVSKRLVRDIRYVPEEITEPDAREFIAVLDKAGSEGVLLYGDTLAVIRLARRMSNKSGRVEAIICDICATWQRGSNSATLTLVHTDKHTSSYLVCADLDCSLHVRDMTAASKISRTQLREHMAPEDRIARLRQRLEGMVV